MSDPPGGLKQAGTRETLSCRTRRPEGGVAHVPTRFAWTDPVTAPARALSRSGNRETPCVSRTFGRCPQKRTR
ncbi:MAG: hypothetical protein OXG81_17165 [Acidobacteria bacterium]|nr:hypothetical protein [Acidobacteriota bacterium]